GEFDSHPVLHRGRGRMVRHRSRVPALLRDGGSIPPPAAISLESTGMWIPTGLESRSAARVAVRVPGSAQAESFNSAAFRQLCFKFFDLLLDLLGREPVYLNCVIKRFHLEHSLPASFIAKRGTETVMAQRTVNQDARPGT